MFQGAGLGLVCCEELARKVVVCEGKMGVVVAVGVRKPEQEVLALEHHQELEAGTHRRHRRRRGGRGGRSA
jgi:hypothetical protein